MLGVKDLPLPCPLTWAVSLCSASSSSSSFEERASHRAQDAEVTRQVQDASVINTRTVQSSAHPSHEYSQNGQLVPGLVLGTGDTAVSRHKPLASRG